MIDTAHWPAPADADSAALGWSHWEDRAAVQPDAELAAFARAVATPGEPGHGMLAAAFGGSPHLTRLVLDHPDIVRGFLGAGPDAQFRAEIDATVAALSGPVDREAVMRGLRRMKRRTALVTALADIGGLWTLSACCRALTEIAETALRLACRHLLRVAAGRGWLTLDNPEEPEHGSGLIVLAMGKLGAGELNYSSDIDIVVLFDKARVAAADCDQIPRTFLRLTRDLVTIMEERTAFGYVFRTDLRLRPDPAATPLAVSVAAAETYYGSMAQTWERAAMIKARPVAGDPEAGAAFAAFLRRFVWRRDLDFAALDDIHAIKRQIQRHRGHRVVAVDGHDIKVGRGGIREIEFFAQTQQLIFGGRMPQLRTPRTVDALAAMAEAGKLPADVCRRLTDAYWELRRIEHRLQMVDDHQVTALPASAQEIGRLARFLGFADADAFRRHVRAVLGTVEEIYSGLFEDRLGGGEPDALGGLMGPPDSGDDTATAATLADLGFQNPEGAMSLARVWLSGRYRATRSPRARSLLQDLLPTLATAFGRTASPDMAWRRMDEFLSRLPAGVQLFSMFAANPRLLDLVATILGTSERLANHLALSPAQLDAVLDPDFFEALPDLDALAADLTERLDPNADYEDMLDGLRRWTNDQRFRAGIQMLLGLSDPADDGARFLSDVAQVALDALADRVQAAFEERHGGFGGRRLAIVAMGKLGSREMSVRSDLDLIMIYDPPAEPLAESDGAKPLAAPLYYQRLIQRLISAITAQTAHGTLFEVDMRLRPSGKAGPLATSLPAFAKYQAEDAWTWEHQALTRARVIHGSADLAGRIGQVIADAIAKPRDPERLRADVADMRGRIDRAQGSDDPWNVKFIRGGMVEIEFIAQYLQLRSAATERPVREGNTAAALEALAEAGHLVPEVAEDLRQCLTIWQRVQAFIRLTHDGAFDPAAATKPLLDGLSRCVFPEVDPPLDRAALEERLAALAARAHRHFREIVGLPSPETG
ncbi:MAG: bifunctional [glutamine synthetase] adenylyltransferase/[glutamine synthetase]-adenylyl-L-tyrosine phosphorylase [Rhodospirillaceae bacterium]|nr:bifunctional [glutamine synthetase] adenylyltransferase/[glutamine synthetase]-adenylyl-L-tyrosine phosphorylase [Rhodospirillaceae bacterium]